MSIEIKVLNSINDNSISFDELRRETRLTRHALGYVLETLVLMDLVYVFQTDFGMIYISKIKQNDAKKQ